MADANCEVCGKPISVMIFKGTGVCNEICRKVRSGEIHNAWSGKCSRNIVGEPTRPDARCLICEAETDAPPIAGTHADE